MGFVEALILFSVFIIFNQKFFIGVRAIIQWVFVLHKDDLGLISGIAEQWQEWSLSITGPKLPTPQNYLLYKFKNQNYDF